MKKKSQNKTNARKAKKRVYDNSSRLEKSKQTEKNIIEALVALLVERRGGDVSMSEIAAKTGITERTIFRFFSDKKTLHQAMDNYLLSYLQASAHQMQDLNFVGFAKNTFAIFDRHEALTMAYLFSPFGQEARALFRKKLNHAMIAKIVKERNLEMSDDRLRRLALVTSLVNAKIWFDIKQDYGFSGEEMASSMEWAVNTLLDKV